MKQMRKYLGALLGLAVLVTLLTTTVLATNVSEIVYASNLVDGDDIVLIGDTTLYVNADVSLKSISGDYALEIHSDGEHTLTVDNPNGSAIYVKTLKSVKPSQGTVNLTIKGGDDYFAIATTGDISLDGIKLDAKGGAGIRSEEGNVTINGTNVSGVGSDGIGVVANSGSISIDSDYLFVQCAGQSGDAMWEHGIGAAKDVTIISEDATIAGSIGIESDTGNIILNGNIAVGGTGTAVYAVQGTITMTGAVTAQGGNSNYAIYAEGNISFDGTTLNVNGGAGIRTYEGNITIDGTNVSVVGQDGIGVLANSGSIYIDSDYLFVQCAGQSGDAEWEHGIGATNDVTIISNDATITGRWGVDSDKGNITLSGNIWVGATKCAIIANEGTITMTGAVTAQGGDEYYVIAASGDISFDGTKLDVSGSAGIRSYEGNITINGTYVSVVGQDGVGVIANSGSIYLDSDYLFVQCAGQSGDAEWEHGIGATNDVTIISNDATITGRWGVDSDKGNITLSGNIWVGATKCAIIANEGTITMTGAVTAQGGDEYYVIAASGDISFDGTKLDVSGSAGIRSYEGNITINGTYVSVVGQDGVGVIANSGSIYLDSDYLFVQCAGQSGDAIWEHGIGALKDVTIISDDATIAGRYGVASDEGNISLTGTFWVGARKSAICATAGNITVNGDLTANNTDGNYYCVVSGEGDITLSNGTFNITSASNAVITHNGSIYLNGDITVSSSEADSCAINAREGNIVIQGGSLDVTTGGTHALGAANGNIEITQPLQIVVPQNGRVDTNNLVNGSVIVDADGDPVSHVEIGQAIGSVSISINSPVAGEKPASTVYSLPEHCKQQSVEWFVSDIPHGNNEPFTAGLNYKVKIVLKADEGYRFASGVLAKLNGKDATTGWNDGGKELIITYTFSDCPASIKNVALTVTAPSDGNSISYSVTDESTGYSVGNNSNYVSWYVSDNGVDYTPMTSGDKFIGGKYYKVEMEVRTHTGYEFALKDVGSIQPDVSATVNGYKATVIKTYDQDPSESITVQYNFGLCNDTIIEEINIVDVPKPVPGEKPVYTVAVSGTGYHIENRNASREVYEGGQYVDKYYIRNGIAWWDVTNGGYEYVYENDVFLPGHDYQCVVYVQTDDGCEFIQDLYANPEVWPTATVNGNEASILKEGSGLTTNQQVRYTFEYEIFEISEVAVLDIDVPMDGAHPDYQGAVGNSILYEFAPYGYDYVGFYWLDSEGIALEPSDTFHLGQEYTLEIKLAQKMDGQTVLTKFKSPITATINGKPADGLVAVTNSGKNVAIYQSYTCTEATAPIGVNVSGFVQADFGTVKPSAALYSTNDTEHTNPLYTAEIGSAVKNGDRFDWAFTISDVPAGTYDLVITKDGHQNSVQQITVSSTNKNVGVIALSVLATSAWSGDTCTVTLEVFEEGVSVMVASYEDGKLEKVEYLTMYDDTAILTGDNVKVFFLNDETHAPIRKVMEMIKP